MNPENKYMPTNVRTNPWNSSFLTEKEVVRRTTCQKSKGTAYHCVPPHLEPWHYVQVTKRQMNKK